MIPIDAELNEVIEFKHKPINENSIKFIQAHFGLLGVHAAKRLKDELVEDDRKVEVDFTGELTIYGENGYTTSDLGKFIDGILHDLPNADGFKIVTNYYCSADPWLSTEDKKWREEEFSSVIAEIGKTEDLTYLIFEFEYQYSEGWTGKFENGEWVDLEEQFSTEIAEKTYDNEWWTISVLIDIEFYFDKYPEILEALRNCVRKYVPHEALKYCEDDWNMYGQETLVAGIQWNDKNFKNIKAFLDEINSIVEPIKGEFKAYTDGYWYQTTAPFAVATWDWDENGFKVVGTEL